jgi:formate-dependent phosphoribosylglycinamide formyltransferase (GAR transformylase)
VLKTARFGYDGKGQARVRGRADLEARGREWKEVPCVLEQLLPLELEVSVVLARGEDGAIAVFPVAENSHAGGILDVTIAPARIAPAMAVEARALASKIANGLDYVGVLAVEMFVVDGKLLMNEIAPRPHNSGHYTIDACRTVAIRAAGARALRPAAGRSVAAHAGGDGEPAGRHLVGRRARLDRPCWPIPARTCTSTANARRVPDARWDT